MQYTEAVSLFLKERILDFLIFSLSPSSVYQAENHGPAFEAVVKEYRKMMNRLKLRFGISKPSTSLSYVELEEWLDKKTMYENMFSKREFWKEMDKSELPGFFRDCGHYPNRQEIEDVWCLINQGSSGTQAEVLKRKHVVEIAFTLYPPKGANLTGRTTRQSTWVSPIVDGEEGYKYLVSNHPVLKEADIHVVGNLVAASIRDRKERLESSRKVEADGIDGSGISDNSI
ncbi:IQ domain-containing protein M [Protopterus annectens]|uniref:IQ domain-containing protein M n=1 Tax=Protopterus annectens TaxID=7888 RepID=UPI001CF96261|nr:IQ domain-containing protein M [Protopterus annectens]